MQHKIVIRRHRPWLRTLLIAGAACGLLVSAVAIFSFARSSTASNYREAQTELEQLRDQRRSLTRELRAARSELGDLKDQVVYAQRSSEIDTQACADVHQSLTGLQGEVADLREQVAFYRGIVSPDESRSGVRVLELKILPQQDPSLWRMDLVLIQSVRHDKRVAGDMDVSLIGSNQGQQQTLKLAPLLLPDMKLSDFSFKYFEEFSVQFRLPAGFRPMRVAVNLVPGDGLPQVDNEFEWAKVQAETPTENTATISPPGPEHETLQQQHPDPQQRRRR